MRTRMLGLTVVLGLLCLALDCNPTPGPRRETTTPPKAVIVGPTGPVNAGASAQFSGLNSVKGTYAIVRYSWDCGQSLATNCQQDHPTPTFVYVTDPNKGRGTQTVTYTVRLTVVDQNGNQDTTTALVQVTQVYGV